jgi:hypothetical protein
MVCAPRAQMCKAHQRLIYEELSVDKLLRDVCTRAVTYT